MSNKAERQQAFTDDSAGVNQGDVNKEFINKSIVNVAVAVIHHQEQYLLGFRSSSQHQGNRYEFVGGKIDKHETVTFALIREVAEETGIDIQDNHLVKLGRLHHDYGDKQVCLQVYKVSLTAEQYKQHQHCDYGLEGQALTWAPKNQLLAGDYPLPAANQTILSWLQLPDQIIITYPLLQFSECNDTSSEWLTYHQQHIPKNTWVYIRTKTAELKNKTVTVTKVTNVQLAAQLMHLRPDIYSVLSYDQALQNTDVHQLSTMSKLSEKAKSKQNNKSIKLSQEPDKHDQIVAYHLTHHELMCWFDDFQNNNSEGKSKSSQYNFSNRPLILSCHDEKSIHAANKLAEIRLQQQQPPVVGIFLSPVLATQSHPDSTPLGWETWSTLAQLADMPVIGLGGLSPIMFEQAQQHGAISVAGIRQFLK